MNRDIDAIFWSSFFLGLTLWEMWTSAPYRAMAEAQRTLH